MNRQIRAYWRRTKPYPISRPGEVQVILGRDWTATPLTRSGPHDTGWKIIDHTPSILDLPGTPGYDEGVENSARVALGIDSYLPGGFDHVALIDGTAVWGALIVAGFFQPALPADLLHGCLWSPEDIKDGGDEDCPSAAFLELQAACEAAWRIADPDGMAVYCFEHHAARAAP